MNAAFALLQQQNGQPLQFVQYPVGEGAEPLYLPLFDSLPTTPLYTPENIVMMLAQHQTQQRGLANSGGVAHVQRSRGGFVVGDTRETGKMNERYDESGVRLRQEVFTPSEPVQMDCERAGSGARKKFKKHFAEQYTGKKDLLGSYECYVFLSKTDVIMGLFFISQIGLHFYAKRKKGDNVLVSLPFGQITALSLGVYTEVKVTKTAVEASCFNVTRATLEEANAITCYSTDGRFLAFCKFTGGDVLRNQAYSLAFHSWKNA